MPDVRERAREAEGFRGDINGLRALAIVPVVAFHAGATVLPGGFVGVDVFYVVSGYLITTILVREVERTGSVRLGAFWAKRVRRLGPALALVVAVTLLVSAVVFSPVRWVGLGLDAAAALASLSNVVFASRATDYFAEPDVPSPFLHTWSLGIEEQFYVLWPVLIVAAALVARRSGVGVRRALAVAFCATAALSFVLSVLFTPVEPTWSFYLLPTRAWEFAAAGLLALVPADRLVRSRLAANAAGGAGLVLLVGSILLIRPEDPFPGWIAAVPVLGTLLLIAAGSRVPGAEPSVVSRGLALRPLQWIGTVSYAWYLWHWPFIVFSTVLVPTDSAAERLVLGSAAGIAALGAAALTARFVEAPLRFHHRLVPSIRRSFLVVGSVTAAAVLVSGTVAAAGTAVTAREPYKGYADVLAGVPDQSCERTESSAAGRPVCVLGDVDAGRTVMLVGDSHAGHWKAAMGEAAAAEGIRLVVRWRSSCPAAPVVLLDTRGVRDTECASFQSDTLDLIAELRPEAVVLSQSAAYGARILSSAGERIDPEQRHLEWRSAVERLIVTAADAGATSSFVVDNPRLDFDPIECVSRLGVALDGLTTDTVAPEGREGLACVEERRDAVDGIEALNGVTALVAAEHGLPEPFDVTDDICDAENCYAQRDGLPIYRDGDHLSAAWTATHVPTLRNWFSALLA